MASYELLGLNEATPQAVAPTASDTGVVSNLTVTTNLTNTAGTANGVTYLNGSKVLTSGSGLQYNGTGFSITGTQSANLFSVNASGGGDQFQVSALAAGNGSVAASLNTGSSDYEPFRLIGEYLQFDTRTGVGTATERARIDSDGLKFNGDTAAANALDDYEEGTWTPTLTLTTPGDSSSATPVGIYTKIGNTVFIQGRITFTKGTGSGDLVFGSLPFTANSTSGYQATAAISTDEFGVAGKIYNMFLQNSQTVPSLFSIAQAGGAGAAASASDFGASAISIRFSLTYHV